MITFILHIIIFGILVIVSLGLLLGVMVAAASFITKKWFSNVYNKWFAVQSVMFRGELFKRGDRVVIKRMDGRIVTDTITKFETYDNGMLRLVFTNTSCMHVGYIESMTKAKDKINHLPEWF